MDLMMRNSTPLEYQKKGLSVILETVPIKINTSKLRVILILEADFNIIYNIIFNSRLMLAVESKKYIPYKVIGGRKN